MTHPEDTELRKDLRGLVDRVCADFPDEYWRELDRRRGYPEEFVAALTKTVCLGALVPEEYGGIGLGLGDTSVLLEQVNRNGGNAGPVHAQLYTMGAILRHGSEEQRRQYLPGIASGDIRLQAFAAVPGRADLDQPHPVPRRHARAEDAAVVLIALSLGRARPPRMPPPAAPGRLPSPRGCR
jgi:acyl-CoA dehydrogenase